VWASCDGTAGLSTGVWRGGWFVTVWKRQKKLYYKWVLADAAPLSTMPPPPDWITGKLADCPPRAPRDAAPTNPRPLPAAIPPGEPGSRDGRSDDGSLAWRSTVLPNGSHSLRVWAFQDGVMRAVVAR
jgi:hypothetical protein